MTDFDGAPLSAEPACGKKKNAAKSRKKSEESNCEQTKLITLKNKLKDVFVTNGVTLLGEDEINFEKRKSLFFARSKSSRNRNLWFLGSDTKSIEDICRWAWSTWKSFGPEICVPQIPNVTRAHKKISPWRIEICCGNCAQSTSAHASITISTKSKDFLLNVFISSFVAVVAFVNDVRPSQYF